MPSVCNPGKQGRCRRKRALWRWASPWTGRRHAWGGWLSASEGAQIWLSVVTDCHKRGVQDCFIACVDRLKGLPEAIEAVVPKTQVQ